MAHRVLGTDISFVRTIGSLDRAVFSDLAFVGADLDDLVAHLRAFEIDEAEGFPAL